MEVVPPPSQQYCLKWNNHSHNISGVFDRSRGTNDFVDVTLATADHQTIDCHKLLLSAGSSYLEQILRRNPSDHPTIVLSNIDYAELRLIVDFMYTGEVAVEQEHLQKLLAAAKTLKVKGLFENTSSEPADNLDEDADKGAENQDAVSTQSLMEEKEKAVQRFLQERKASVRNSLDTILSQQQQDENLTANLGSNINSSHVASTDLKQQQNISSSLLSGSQKRKRKKPSALEEEPPALVTSSNIKMPKPSTCGSTSSGNGSFASSPASSSSRGSSPSFPVSNATTVANQVPINRPVDGVSNVYFLSTANQLSAKSLLAELPSSPIPINETINGLSLTKKSTRVSDKKEVTNKQMIDLPSLISQTSSPSAMSPSQLLSHLTTPLSLPNTPVALPPLSLTASSSVTASPTLLTSPSISSADQPMPKLLAQLANAGPAKSDVASLLLSSKPSPAVVSSPPKESPVVTNSVPNFEALFREFANAERRASTSSSGGKTSPAPSNGSTDGGGLLSGVAGVRRYKRYTEESLQQALREIIAGQSINRSSNKHNIPARTLRDWMKRLNIKSVFTHHSQNGGVKKPSDSESADDGASIKVEDTNGEEDDEEEEEEIGAPNGKENKINGGIAFPGMTLPSLPLPLEAVAGMKLPAAVAAKMEENAGTNNSEEDEEEEEIDDDEEMSLKIDESARA